MNSYKHIYYGAYSRQVRAEGATNVDVEMLKGAHWSKMAGMDVWNSNAYEKLL